MQKLVIIGAGGFGREVQWLVERMNQQEKTWNLMGYIDDGMEKGTIINGLPVLGSINDLIKIEEKVAVACAIGTSATRKKVLDRLKNSSQMEFPNLIDPSVLVSDLVCLGKGIIICAGSVLTVNITVEDFVIINLDCTIGHDSKLSRFVTLYPSVNISGNVFVGEETELGTGTQIIQGMKVLNHSIVGAGAVVVKDIPSKCTAVGSPAKPIRFYE